MRRRPLRARLAGITLSSCAICVLLTLGCGERPPAPTPPETPAYGRDGTPLREIGSGPRPDLVFLFVPGLRRDFDEFDGDLFAFAPLEDPTRKWSVQRFDAFTPSPDPTIALASLLTGELPSDHAVAAGPTARLLPAHLGLDEVLAGVGYTNRRARTSDGSLASRRLFSDRTRAFAPTRAGPEGLGADIGTHARDTVPDAWWIQVGDLGPPYPASGDDLPPLPPEAAGVWSALNALEGGARPADPAHRRALAGELDAAAQAALAVWWRRAYADALARSSAEVEALLRAILTHAGEAPPLVILVGLNGLALGEAGHFGAGLGLSPGDVEVPLWIFGSARRARPVPGQGPASLLDLLPTVLAELELPPHARVRGRDLLGAGRDPGEAVVSELVLDHAARGVRGEWRQTLAANGRWRYTLTWDARAGTVIESLRDRTASAASERAVAGRVPPGVALPAAFCTSIERIRDRIWGGVAGAEARALTAYATGAATVTGDRPAACGSR